MPLDRNETVQSAARIVAEAMTEAGMNPATAIDHPVVRGVVQKWLAGEWRRDEVVEACADLLMMYPDLRAE
jgi:hypothetical protein